MRELLASITTREVLCGGRIYRVRPPTVREALVVMSFDWDLTREVCTPWLGVRLGSYLFADDSPRGEVYAFLLKLLSLGVIDHARHERDKKHLEKRQREVRWFEIVAEYARGYSMPPASVLDESWPFFVAQYAQLDRQYAREMLRNAAWYAGVKTGKLDSVQRRAYDIQVARIEVPESMNEEWQKRQLEKIRNLRQKEAKA